MKKIFSLIVILVLILIIGFQAYFDWELRKTNGAIIGEVLKVEEFLKKELPDKVADFNKAVLPTNPPQK